MIKVLFVCHGNICRSPMAEFILKNMVKNLGVEDDFYIASAATSTEEIGNPVYPPARRMLAKHGISAEGKYAIQIKPSDYDYYDYIICMDSRNLSSLRYSCGFDTDNKVSKLLSFAGKADDIADPWYTDRFDIAYNEIKEGCEGFLKKLGY